MKRLILRILLFLPSFLIIILTSCGGSPDSPSQRTVEKDCGPVRHARGFCIEDKDGYKEITVLNPWQGASDRVFTYYLVERGETVPEGIDPDKVIRTPVESIICLSTTHVALIDFLGKTEKIKAVSNRNLINNSRLKQRMEKGELPDIGFEQNLNYEKIVSIQPDIVMAYGVDSEATGYLDKLRELGITVVMNGEYLEPTPLAQAEWVRFMAAFLGLDEKAEEKFTAIENEYKELVDLASQADDSPVIMAGLPWQNNWFVPGGRSFFATLVNDAGGDYLWAGNDSRENFPVDMEKVFEAGQNADIWLNTGTASTKEDILKIDRRLGQLPPFKNGRVYNNNARVNKHGGNDYWESGITSPHIILRDLISIIHPELLPRHETVYFRKVEEK